MTPDELDRALEEALHVEPPAGYTARVRARIAAEQAAPTGEYARYGLAAVAAAALLVVAAGLVVERDRPPLSVATPQWRSGGTLKNRPPGEAARPAPETRERASAVVVDPGPGRVVRAGTAGQGPSAERVGATPAVLISPDDTAGLQLLVTLAETPLPEPAPDDSDADDPLQVGRIDVVPIEVDPLPTTTPVAIGELQ